MAASRIASSAKRIFHRYQMFFVVAFMLVTIQLYLGYSFYNINQEELRQLEVEWSKRTSDTKAHQSRRDLRPDPDFSDLGQGAESVHYPGHGGVARQPEDLPIARQPENLPIARQPEDVAVVRQQKDVPVARQPSERNITMATARVAPPVADFDPAKWTYRPRCDITDTDDKEAFSAIQRAETDACKQQIADVVCDSRDGKLWPQEIHETTCPLRTMKKGSYRGCYRDDPKARVLNQLTKTFPTDNTVDSCINMCLTSGFDFAGLEWGRECWCAEKLVQKRTVSLPEEECNTPCPGEPTQACGGYNALSIYLTGAGARTYVTPPLVDPSDVPSGSKRVRIAFVLTLNGRALRQVKRLIKALYHTDHYFLVHVDARQDYLYRELERTLAAFPNIRMMPRRYATIWGGANLSTMLLACMEHLFSIQDWAWDFFINLSESDFPVRPIEQIVAYLTTNKDKNFLKTHGKDTPRPLSSLVDMLTVHKDKNFITGLPAKISRFIHKQGLERTFVQCDNHMYRVGKRTLPRGIRVDGGSDWIALNREYCHYLVTSDDKLLKDLKAYWTYTLLPGESFWHTVLQNTEFCTTFANNNLHTVNWNRRKGCKCQYKAIVDWCGCSPNDYLATDMDKFMTIHEKKKIVFFARKFEAIVSQEIINQLDAFLYGSYPLGTPALTLYWESRYHWEDVTTVTSDADLTFYDTLARGALTARSHALTGGAHCALSLDRVLEVSVYQQLDMMQGLLVKFQAHDHDTDTMVTMETLYSYHTEFSKISNIGQAAWLRDVQIGTRFDPKEEIFRNHGSLMGPHTTPTVAIFMVGSGLDKKKTGKDPDSVSLTVTVTDPAGVIAATFEVTGPREELDFVATFEVSVSQPLRPGVWTVGVLYLWDTVATATFVITPYTVYGGRPITDAEARMLHAGPKGGIYSDDEESANQDTVEIRRANQNAARVGAGLRDWAAEVTSRLWTHSDTCVSVARQSSPCVAGLPECRLTTWSTEAPDPKSELGLVNPNTGRLR